MKALKGLQAIAVVALLGVAAYGGLRFWRGPSGATTTYGGALAPQLLPEFPATDAARWVNGAPAPLASLRGGVVLIEAWAPA